MPYIGKQCWEQLKSRLQAGEYDLSTDAKEFAKILTEYILQLNKDKHNRAREIILDDVIKGADVPLR